MKFHIHLLSKYEARMTMYQMLKEMDKDAVVVTG